MSMKWSPAQLGALLKLQRLPGSVPKSAPARAGKDAIPGRGRDAPCAARTEIRKIMAREFGLARRTGPGMTETSGRQHLVYFADPLAQMHRLGQHFGVLRRVRSGIQRNGRKAGDEHDLDVGVELGGAARQLNPDIKI